MKLERQKVVDLKTTPLTKKHPSKKPHQLDLDKNLGRSKILSKPQILTFIHIPSKSHTKIADFSFQLYYQPQPHYTPSLKPPPHPHNTVKKVSHPFIFPIFDFSIIVSKPPLPTTYHRKKTRAYPCYHNQYQGTLTPTPSNQI